MWVVRMVHRPLRGRRLRQHRLVVVFAAPAIRTLLADDARVLYELDLRSNKRAVSGYRSTR